MSLNSLCSGNFILCNEIHFNWHTNHLILLFGPFFSSIFFISLQPVNVVLAGDSGEGMTGGTIAGIVICNLILNRPHPWIEIYSPTRLPPVSQDTVSQAFEEIQEVAAVSPQTSNTNILILTYAEEK